jgi:uncharacterized membrane protein
MNPIQLIRDMIFVHPWHPLTVHFPIALTATALLFVVLALWRKSKWLEHAAYFTMALVVLGTIVAGLTGLRDNLLRYDGAAPFAPDKLFLAGTLLVISLVTTLSRLTRRDMLWQPNTMVLYVAGFVACFGLAATLGLLGGIILYGV